jgi:transposase-like protein
VVFLFQKLTKKAERRVNMARGQKYNEEIKERAFAMFAVYGNMSYISRRLGVPRGTLNGWKKEFERLSEENDVIAKLRQVKKADFITRAWQAVNMSQTLLERALNEMLAGTRKIDEDKLIRIIGTLYDKQALASCEPTEIVEGAIKRFEDFNDEDEQT